MDTLPPIHTSHLFAELNRHLIDLLTRLTPEEWNKPTVCSLWSVKDIASHLLDGNIRRLAAQRDAYRPVDAQTSFASHDDLMAYLNRLNAEWTQATRRISPRTLIEMLKLTGAQVAELFQAADPDAPALFPVAWAGEAESLMWFDIAREYTERWHHQRQIAAAVGAKTPIDARHLYHPVLDTFMRALPFTLQKVEAKDGTVVCVYVVGDAGGQWFASHDKQAWRSATAPAVRPAATITLNQDDAWKVFTKRRDAETKLNSFPDIQLDGDIALAKQALEMVSIMA
jgi:uncharacterized protein (TIGR03083 family)